MVFIHQLLLGVGDLSSFEESLVFEQSLLQTIVYLLSLWIKSLVDCFEFQGLSVRILMSFFAKIKPFNYGGLVDTGEYYVTNLLHCEHSRLFKAHWVEVLLVRHISTFKFRELWYSWINCRSAAIFLEIVFFIFIEVEVLATQEILLGFHLNILLL